jgi:hypothetical protein
MTNTPTWIPPFTILEVICNIPKLSNPSRIHLRAEHRTHNFEVTNSTHPNLEIIPTMSMFQNLEHVAIQVITNTQRFVLRTIHPNWPN